MSSYSFSIAVHKQLKYEDIDFLIEGILLKDSSVAMRAMATDGH